MLPVHAVQNEIMLAAALSGATKLRTCSQPVATFDDDDVEHSECATVRIQLLACILFMARHVCNPDRAERFVSRRASLANATSITQSMTGRLLPTANLLHS